MIQPFLDACGILVTLVSVRWCARGFVDDSTIALGLVTVIVFLLSSQLTGLQRRHPGESPNEELASIAVTWAVTVLALAVVAYVTRAGEPFARSIVLTWILMAPAMIGLNRMGLRIVQRGFLRRGIGIRRVAIAGCNELADQTRVNIASAPALGWEVVGCFDDRQRHRHRPGEASVGELSGSLQELVRLAHQGSVDTVLVTLPMRAENRIRYLLDQLSDTTASVYIVPDFFVFELLHARWTNLGGLPAVSVFENPLFGVDGIAKRAADLTIAVVALVVLAIPMTMIALAVKWTSPGPVLFRQRRYGLDGHEIRVYKFRSMSVCDDGAVVKQARRGDSRITPLGAILRRTSLDELPQLFNVLNGSMSLVGPRPHATAHNEQYRKLIRGYMLRHKVKPGITGLAQINGCRGETDSIDKMERRVEWDHQYIRSWSLWLDLKILAKTAAIVWRQPEAY